MATAKPTTRTNRTRTFTDTWIKGSGPLSASEWADKPSPGLRLRTTAKGTKTFFYRYRLNGKTDKITIGTYPGTTLQDARDQWREYSTLRKKGIDPARHLEAEAKKAREAEVEAAKADDYTLTRLVKDYLDYYSRNFKSWERRESILKRHLAPYLTRRADELLRGDVRDVLAKLRDENKAVMANRTLDSIRAMYNWAISEDWPAHQGFLTLNPAWQVKATKEAPRQRALNDKELGTVLRKLPESGMAEAVQDLLVFALLTGCRIGEVCSMQWQHVHGDEWRLPGDLTKNGRDHTVYLSSQALAILAKHKEGTHVFSNPDTRHGHVREDTSERGLRRALGIDVRVSDRVNRLGVEPFKFHDLRRSLATWLGESEVDERVHDRMLNHHKTTIAAVYNTARYNRPAREWWSKWGAHIHALASDNVVPLKKRDA